jgi:outer membrane biosynthesis protein TonB
MLVNESLKKSNRCNVFSLPCKCVLIGTYETNPGWIDFGDRGFSFFASQPGSDDEFKEIVDLFYEHIRTLKLAHRISSVNVQLSAPLNDYKQFFDADDDDQFIRVEMEKDDLIALRNDVAPMIQECRERAMVHAEMLQKASAPPKISITTIPLHASSDMDQNVEAARNIAPTGVAHTVTREVIETHRKVQIQTSDMEIDDEGAAEPIAEPVKQGQERNDSHTKGKAHNPVVSEKEYVEKQSSKQQSDGEEEEYKPPRTRKRKAASKTQAKESSPKNSPKTAAKPKAKTPTKKDTTPKRTPTSKAGRNTPETSSKSEDDEKTASSGKKAAGPRRKRAASPEINDDAPMEENDVATDPLQKWDQIVGSGSKTRRPSPKKLDNPEESGYEDSYYDEQSTKIAKNLFAETLDRAGRCRNLVVTNLLLRTQERKKTQDSRGNW